MKITVIQKVRSGARILNLKAARKLPTDLVKKIIQMRSSGKSYSFCAWKLGVSRMSVRRYWRKYCEMALQQSPQFWTRNKGANDAKSEKELASDSCADDNNNNRKSCMYIHCTYNLEEERASQTCTGNEGNGGVEEA